MTDEHLYDYTDNDGKKRIVRKVRRHEGHGYSTFVVDVEDVETGDSFPGVKETDLRERPPE